MINKILVTSVFFLMFNTTFGQMVNIGGNGGTVLREQKYSKIDGSPFLFPTYKSAKVFDRQGDNKSVFAKYDSYKEEIEIHNDGNPIILDSKLYGAILFDFIDEIENKRVSILFKNGFDIEGYRSVDYFQVIKSKGDIRLLKKITTELIDDKETSYGGNNDVTSKFLTSERYFILRGDKVNMFKKVSKPSILKVFGNNEADISFLKKSKNKLKSIEDLVEYLEYKENN